MCNGYATIGLLAPLLVLIGRLLRDFRQGWNWAECRFICPRLLHRGTKALRELAVGQPVGSGDGRRACRRGAQLNSTAGENDSMGMARSTATRVGIIPFLFRLRRSLQETDEFVARKHRPTTSMLWLVREPSFTRLLIVELWLSFIYGQL